MRVLCAVLFTALSLAAGGFDDLMRYAHPNAQFLCGVEWQAIANSELVTGLKTELAGARSQMNGLEFVDQLDRALVSSPGKTRNAHGAEAPQLLLVLSGKFRLAELRQRSISKRFKGVEWISPKDGKEEMRVAVLGPNLLLVGDTTSLAAALERGPATPSGPLYRSAAAAAAAHPLWIAANSPGTLAKTPNMTLSMAEDVRTISGGMDFARGLDLDLHLVTGTAPQATRLATAMQAIATLQLANASNTPGAANLLRRLKVAHSGTEVQLTANVTTAEIREMIQGVKQSFGKAMLAQSGGPSVTSVTMPATPPIPEKKVIRIIGLDDGPREIPFSN
jgi:hypothetical protein